ncbi:response regulator transcription factor [Burkholderia ambifaria]|uniref:response regulator transcription factor n=1 Tax=Burkholderia ambifaria TaxID=152480 RepID=UPI000F7FB4C7|nr:response regulator transcription factor [Burkholderia ambifaria]UEP25797.1 response regulator transcription factor [Burkholderia ambifaria]WAS58544.1 response regulator transcription factor [Burkholderia ambifaria]WDR97720.1 response regulator transcription factor [Burkholderia ambifaria]
MKSITINTIVMDDCPLTLAGMKYIASITNSIGLLGICRNSEELFYSLRNSPCDVVMMNYSMRSKSEMGGLPLLGYLRRTFPELRIVTLLTQENPVIIRSILERDVSAVVSKFDDVGYIIAALYASHGGGRYLSPSIKSMLDSCSAGRSRRAARLSAREIEIVRLFGSGMSIGKIAEHLNKAKQTISAQKVNAMKKLGVGNDVDLIKCAISLNLVSDIE